MRRTSVILMAAVVAVLGLFGVAYASHVFPDVSDDNAHAESIGWAHEAGVVDGYEDGTFGPEDNITRGQAASMFDRYDSLAVERLNGLSDFVSDGEDGADGRNGRDGVDGRNGANGADGIVDAYTAKPTAEIVNLQPGETGVSVAVCNDDLKAIGGGHKIDGNASGQDFLVIRSQPIGSYENDMFDSWEVIVRNTGTQEINVQVAIVCANVN